VSVLDVEVFRLTPRTNIKEFEAVMATAQRLGATSYWCMAPIPTKRG